MPKKIHASPSATPTTCGKGRKSRMNQDFMPRVLRKAQKESQNAKVKMQNRKMASCGPCFRFPVFDFCILTFVLSATCVVKSVLEAFRLRPMGFLATSSEKNVLGCGKPERRTGLPPQATDRAGVTRSHQNQPFLCGCQGPVGWKEFFG
jgi:hypothetical protein